ncbi:unnamed protein product [Cercospora beticola]|nr:unnamed protein product [Cercospora beticola]
MKLNEGTFEAFVDQLETCIETWIFANKYSMCFLQDAAMLAFCWHLQLATGNAVGLPASCLALCFSQTAEGSPLRKLAADYIVTRMQGEQPDAGELVGKLAPLQGFIQALNEAHQFHHDAGKDTRRRYQRPREFIESLGTQRDRDEGVNLVGFTISWTRYTMTCHQCGYSFFEGTAKCLECRSPGKKCLGGCETGSLCWWCSEDKPTWDGSEDE